MAIAVNSRAPSDKALNSATCSAQTPQFGGDRLDIATLVDLFVFCLEGRTHPEFRRIGQCPAHRGSGLLDQEYARLLVHASTASTTRSRRAET